MIIKNDILMSATSADVQNGTIVIPKNVRIIWDASLCGLPIEWLIVPQTIEYIGDYALNCKRLKSVKFDNPNCKISSGVFQGCEKLEHIDLPDAIEEIFEITFNGCKSLQSIKLPNTIQFLDDSAFHGCKNLEELWVSDSLDHLYLHSFHGCEKLKKIHWKGKLYTIDDLIAYNTL